MIIIKGSLLSSSLEPKKKNTLSSTEFFSIAISSITCVYNCSFAYNLEKVDKYRSTQDGSNLIPKISYGKTFTKRSEILFSCLQLPVILVHYFLRSEKIILTKT